MSSSSSSTRLALKSMCHFGKVAQTTLHKYVELDRRAVPPTIRSPPPTMPDLLPRHHARFNIVSPTGIACSPSSLNVNDSLALSYNSSLKLTQRDARLKYNTQMYQVISSCKLKMGTMLPASSSSKLVNRKLWVSRTRLAALRISSAHCRLPLSKLLTLTVFLR